MEFKRPRRATSVISDRQRAAYELRWILDRIRARTRLGPSVATTADTP